jgi:amidophosphoribosyltransferase
MSTVNELFAPKHLQSLRPTLEELQRMAAELGADSLLYLPIEAVARCIGMDANRLCQACITGRYPTPTGERLYQLALRHQEGCNRRTYEIVEQPTGSVS